MPMTAASFTAKKNLLLHQKAFHSILHILFLIRFLLILCFLLRFLLHLADSHLLSEKNASYRYGKQKNKLDQICDKL